MTMDGQMISSARAIKVAYELGSGIAEIMYDTGKSYEQVRNALGETGATLVTGGPHDTATCRHDHRLSHAHLTGANCCKVTSRRRTARERAALNG